jgi:hypothetical protein
MPPLPNTDQEEVICLRTAAEIESERLARKKTKTK